MVSKFFLTGDVEQGPQYGPIPAFGVLSPKPRWASRALPRIKHEPENGLGFLKIMTSL